MDIWIANKLKAKDSPTKLDEWFVTPIANAQCRRVWNSALNDKTIVRDFAYTVLIPFAGYIDYEDWKNAPTVSFSMSQGDFIFLRNPGDVDRNNIVSKHNELGNNSIQVKNFDVASKEHFSSLRYELKVTG